MTEKEQKSAAKAFAEYWKDKGDEKSDTQSFWLSLLHDVYGVEEPTKYVSFEKRVKDTTTNFIDVYIPSTRVILDARAIYPDCSLADLYDEAVMPPELRKAHQLNDRAVMEAYGFWGKLNSESECVAELMRMYREMTEKE